MFIHIIYILDILKVIPLIFITSRRINTYTYVGECLYRLQTVAIFLFLTLLYTFTDGLLGTLLLL